MSRRGSTPAPLAVCDRRFVNCGLLEQPCVKTMLRQEIQMERGTSWFPKSRGLKFIRCRSKQNDLSTCSCVASAIRLAHIDTKQVLDVNGKQPARASEAAAGQRRQGSLGPVRLLALAWKDKTKKCFPIVHPHSDEVYRNFITACLLSGILKRSPAQSSEGPRSSDRYKIQVT